MGKTVTVIMQDGKKLTYDNAKVVEGKKTSIYQITTTGQVGELLAVLDPFDIKSLYTE